MDERSVSIGSGGSITVPKQIEHFVENYVRGEDEMYYVGRTKCLCPQNHDHPNVRNE